LIFLEIQKVNDAEGIREIPLGGKGFLRQIALSGANLLHFWAFRYFSETP